MVIFKPMCSLCPQLLSMKLRIPSHTLSWLRTLETASAKHSLSWFVSYQSTSNLLRENPAESLTPGLCFLKNQFHGPQFASRRIRSNHTSAEKQIQMLCTSRIRVHIYCSTDKWKKSQQTSEIIVSRAPKSWYFIDS